MLGTQTETRELSLPGFGNEGILSMKETYNFE